MELKRIYDPADLQRFQAEQAAALQEARAQITAMQIPAELQEEFASRMVQARALRPPQVSGFQLGHTGVTSAQNFSTDFVTEMLQAGIMELHENQLGFHVSHEGKAITLNYTILRTPGRYCLHCNEKLEGDEGGQMARLHVAQNHAGAASPDAEQPAGYVWLKHFECVLDKKQHAKYQRQPGVVYAYS